MAVNFAHFVFERGAEIGGDFAEIGHDFAEDARDLGQLLGSQDHEGDEKNDDQMRDAEHGEDSRGRKMRRCGSPVES